MDVPRPVPRSATDPIATEEERMLMTQSTTDEGLAALPQGACLPVTDPGRA